MFWTLTWLCPTSNTDRRQLLWTLVMVATSRSSSNSICYHCYLTDERTKVFEVHTPNWYLVHLFRQLIDLLWELLKTILNILLSHKPLTCLSFPIVSSWPGLFTEKSKWSQELLDFPTPQVLTYLFVHPSFSPFLLLEREMYLKCSSIYQFKMHTPGPTPSISWLPSTFTLSTFSHIYWTSLQLDIHPQYSSVIMISRSHLASIPI